VLGPTSRVRCYAVTRAGRTIPPTYIHSRLRLVHPLGIGAYRAPHLPHNARLADTARFRAGGGAHIAGFRVGLSETPLAAIDRVLTVRSWGIRLRQVTCYPRECDNVRMRESGLW
jgi:hypothetical protein